MTVEDAQMVIDSFRKEGRTDEEIKYAFAMLYFNNQIPLEGLEGLVNLLGYELDEEFKKLPRKEQLKWFNGQRR